MKQKVWFITGASKGLGLALAKQLLHQGHAVAATSRNAESLTTAVNIDSKNFLPLQVDLGNEQSIQQAITKTHKHFGALDVVVNNAGYGIGGAIEELTEKELRQSFEVNVFATLNVIKSAMPYLRKQGNGHIINISSIAGFAAGIGWAAYGAAKFAVVGLSEVLADDVKEFGIQVTVVEPGAFRTSFLSKESLVLTEHPIADYKAVRASHNKYLTMDGEQAGDPEKAAAVFIKLAAMENPPVRLFLGTDAYNRATQKLEAIKTELEQYKDITISTDF